MKLSRATRLGGSSWAAVMLGNAKNRAQARKVNKKYEDVLEFRNGIFTDSSYFFVVRVTFRAGVVE